MKLLKPVRPRRIDRGTGRAPFSPCHIPPACVIPRSHGTLPYTMFAFPVFSIPLGYLALAAWFFPQQREEGLARFFGRGLLFGIPCALVQALLIGLIPEVPGSILFVFRIWWERFLLPFALSLAAYRLAHSFEDTVRSDTALRRFMAYLFGCFTILGAAAAIRGAETPSSLVLFFYPILAIAGIFGAVYFLERTVTEAGLYVALWISAALLASLGFACVTYLFEARLEWLGGILTLALLGANTYLVRFLMR